MALIQITDLTFAYPGSFDNVFEHVSFQLDTDWRLGLTSRNGRGKTTLLRLFAGAVSPSGHDHGRRVRVFPVSGSGRIAYAAGTAGAQLPGCAGMAFPAGTDSARGHRGRTVPLVFHAFRRRTGKASAGAAVRAGGRYLLIDEPTNHLDETSRALVSRYLAKKSGFLLVSHDRAFLDGCVDHILSIGRSSIEVQRGNFSSWYEK